MPQDGVPSYGTTTAESTTTLPALEIPPEVLENCIGFLAGSPDELQTIRLAGAGWARPHPGPFSWQNIQPAEDSYDYTLTDSWVKAAQENNIGLLATIWSYASWDQAKCHKGECVVSTLDQFYPQEGWEEFSIPASRCKPC
ncbi:MAG: hypothetical protein FJY77_01610, partial [Candidatus Altiarchaeales archaeon]|nr:hypothetical protein [Candidatus Altiarchaeales archaeon]